MISTRVRPEIQAIPAGIGQISTSSFPAQEPPEFLQAGLEVGALAGLSVTVGLAVSSPTRKENLMKIYVAKEVAALEAMSVGELRAKYAQVFGEETRVGNKAWLNKRVIWRLQALAEGDLSERARRRAAELAQDADLRLSPPRVAKDAPVPANGNGKASHREPTDHRMP